MARRLGGGVLHRRGAPPLPWFGSPRGKNLQLLYGPQIVPDVRDRLDGDVLVHSLHLLRPKLRDPNPDHELLALRVQRDRGARGQRRVRRREPPACGCQAGTHHVRAREEEADRTAIYADVWEYEWICQKGIICEDYRKKPRACTHELAFVEKAQSGKVWSVKVLEKERLAVQSVY